MAVEAMEAERAATVEADDVKDDVVVDVVMVVVVVVVVEEIDAAAVAFLWCKKEAFPAPAAV